MTTNKKEVIKLISMNDLEDGESNDGFQAEYDSKPRIKARNKRLSKEETIELSPEHVPLASDIQNDTQHSDYNDEQTDGQVLSEEQDVLHNNSQIIESRRTSKLSKGLLKLQKFKSYKNKIIKSDELIKSDNASNNKKFEERAEPQSDSTAVLNVVIHKINFLDSTQTLFHPVICLNIIDSTTGKYVLKTSAERRVTSFYESKSINYVMPVMTKPGIYTNNCVKWEENIVYNEEFNCLVRPEIIFIFEILDFESLKDSNSSNGSQWHRIAWAFLRPVSSNNEYNYCGKQLRLQLYSSHKIAKRINGNSNECYKLWKSKRKTIGGTLCVTIESLSLNSNAFQPTLRSLFPFQSEISIKNSLNHLSEDKTLQNENIENDEKKKVCQNDQMILWTRIEGQACKIPKSLWFALNASGRGCSSSRFSSDGTKLACGVAVDSSNSYAIFIYEIPSSNLINHFGYHVGIIYELDWTANCGKLLSASNDCTARVWTLNESFDCIKSEILPHPCFLYSAKFHIKNVNVVLTAGFDGIIRIWHLNDSTQPELAQQINAHKGSVLCLSWNRVINNKCQIFSGGSDGTVKIINQTSSQWNIISEIAIKELKNVAINSISVYPTGNKLVLFCRDGVHRLIDYELGIIIQKFYGSLNFNHFIRGCISPCGQLVFIGSEDRSVFVWKSETGMNRALFQNTRIMIANHTTGERIHTYFDINFNGPILHVEYHPFDHILVICGLNTLASILLYRHKYETNKTKLDPLDTSIRYQHNLDRGLTLNKQVENAMIILDTLLNQKNE